MKAFSFPYSYLRLRSERGWPTYARDLPAVVALSIITFAPFVTVEGSVFFSKDGFLDKFGSFSGVLTGFYVAALIAVASIPSGSSDLDSVITNGSVTLPASPHTKARELTRRQYVCLMFGYLAFISVVMSILSIASVSLSYGHMPSPLAKALASPRIDTKKTMDLIRAVLVFLCAIPISHMAVTTLRGLYYLTDRIYAKAPRMLPRSPSDTAHSVDGNDNPVK